MSAFQQMIDDLYESELGWDAQYVPLAGGPAFAVRVMKKEPEEITTGFAARAVAGPLILGVRQSQVPAPAEGDILTGMPTEEGAAAQYRVGHFTADAERLEWFMPVTLVA